jgi:eukaryotic-like serine/threonine-protein kinase
MTSSENENLPELYEFGPFRVDPARETLLKAGVSVPLTPKTFQILLVLVRHGQEIVTKDDLMKSVWPDTFVEEANLSRNIFMLRKAMGETAQDHRYIVTIPGRGYRLTENVRLVPGEEFSIAAASHSRVEFEVKETRPWMWIALICVMVLAVAAGLWRLLSPRRAVLSARDTVVLADFANSTGDPVFDDTLRQGLAIELRQSPFLSLISDQRIAHTLRLMGRVAGARLTPELARGICERTGSAAVFDGSIAPLGKQYVVTLEARSCRNGEVLDQEQTQAASKEDVLSALSQIAGRLRNRVGESLSTIQEHNTPLAEVTTPSLEALEAYSAGWKLHTTSGVMAALPLLKRAVEIDPDSLWHKPRWRANTRIWMSPNFPRRVPPGPGNCVTAPVNGKGSTSPQPTKDWQRETLSGHGKTTRHGRARILAIRCLTPCCPGIQTRQPGATNKRSRKQKRR